MSTEKSSLPSVLDKISTTNNEEDKKNKLEMCQIIYYDFSLNKEIEEYLKKVSFHEVGINYNTLAIIGPQSTGKSTLLNKLFDTTFEVMNNKLGRQQTTKGVWIAADKNSKILIIDCEGTDSKSRKDNERNKFEHTSSLFALAMSDILIINMWTSDVGRYTASNYGVLKIVFEMNLKLFEQKTAKKILIFLRDFDKTRHQKNKIEALIMEDIRKIWSEINIPEKYQGKGPESFFSFEFITLPHKLYMEKEFNAEVDLLKERLKETNPNYFFSNLSSLKSVPADGLKQYITQLWTDILNDKDLDIPSQREMLANYRCNEIKNRILSENNEIIKKFYDECNEKDIDNFKERGLEIKNKILSEYEKQAINYEEQIFKNVYEQLKEAINQKLYICFVNQTKRIIPIIQKFMRMDLQKQLMNMEIGNDNYFSLCSKLSKKYLSLLVLKLKAKKIFDEWNADEKVYGNIFDEIIEEQKRKAINKLKIGIIDQFKEQSEYLFLTALENYKKDTNLWHDFNLKYILLFLAKMFPLRVFLKDCYNCENEDIEEILNYLQNKLYNDIKKNINKKMKDLITILIEQFKKKFLFENNEEPRLWNKYEELQIDVLFKKIRENYLPLFDQLKNFEFIKDLFNLINFNEREQYDEDLFTNIIQAELKKPHVYEPLLKQGDINNIKKKYEMKISSILEEVKIKRQGFEVNLPTWFIIALIFFGYDDVFRIAFSWKIVPILIIVGTYFLLTKLELDYILKDIYFECESRFESIKKIIKKYFGIYINKLSTFFPSKH